MVNNVDASMSPVYIIRETTRTSCKYYMPIDQAIQVSWIRFHVIAAIVNPIANFLLQMILHQIYKQKLD